MSENADPAEINRPIAIVILAAGHGSRMQSSTPKVLHEIGGLTMIGHVIKTAQALSPAHCICVVGAGGEAVSEAATRYAPEITIARQDPPQGTGDAVACAMPALENFTGVVVILYADTPLVTERTISTLANASANGVAVLGFKPDVPGAYGRLKTDHTGALAAIVEAKDATPEELEIPMCNAGLMAFDGEFLRQALPQLTNDNAKGEYYLTDLVAIATADGRSATIIEAPATDVIGVNSKPELAVAERLFQARAREKTQAAGALLIDPDTVYFSYDTIIEQDVRIEPSVYFGPGAAVREGATIKAFSHIEGADIGPGASIGPFARLRPETTIGSGAKVGNFVEIKKTSLSENAKVSHLTYLGDADIGASANIGAGVITCNYDGYDKHKTTIGEAAFVGSNTALVAPVTVGRGAYVGSGSVITKNIDDNALAVGRGRQTQIDNWAMKFRRSKGEAD